MEYLSVAEGIAAPGLRLVLTAGVPGPWSVAARFLFDAKGIDYAPVAQEPGGANEELKAWTGQTSAPCAMLDQERARNHWSEILVLAEVLKKDPPLLPADQALRTMTWGIAYEICGEDGLGWNLRLNMMHAFKQAGRDPYPTLTQKFSSSVPLEYSRKRVDDIVDYLAQTLVEQKQRGSRHFVGDALTAVDLYWTAFSTLIVPYDDSICPMPDGYRAGAIGNASRLSKPLSTILIDHRDRILSDHVKTPIIC